MRYALDISYDGTAYGGWQVQPNANTVQAEVEKALSTFFRMPMSCMGAGRTDAGVHARQLAVHFDGPEELEGRFYNSMNGLLPEDIAVKAVYRAVNPDFHARFDAVSRAYEYHVVTQKWPTTRGYAMWVRKALDFEAMNRAAALMPQYEDFASFCKAHADNKTTLCEVQHAYWEQQTPGWVFHIKANRFLRGMVRAVVGTLLLVGEGKISVEEFAQIIEKKDRAYAGPNVKAKGLFLTEVNYPPGSFEWLQGVE